MQTKIHVERQRAGGVRATRKLWEREKMRKGARLTAHWRRRCVVLALRSSSGDEGEWQEVEEP